ncbi:cyclic peptide export ABC transporter [[Flexibacter] sp. ATCC 35208]|uniref:cyclic peptide export ABC transporter n=1 Tax=[Flexibacter] sp. ATCC 35208 TaxID=1936242 RepID=UPI0009D4C038|nr:cyclic peptide export ABC transporter [[Flexibacter] sp. ATCC 35208]OMP77908.1 cyclic peptide transporter [[Flexibacter] sp. ATCC 35208]
MFKISGRNILFLVLFSIPNTLLTMGILVIVNSVITGKQVIVTDHLNIVFFLMVGLAFLLNIISQNKIVDYSNKLIFENELRIMTTFQKAGLSQLEKIGFQRIYGIIEDLRTFVFLPALISGSVAALMMLALCLIYFLVVSLASAIAVMLIIMAITAFYFLVNKKNTRALSLLRELNDLYFGMVDDTLKGFKELKLSTARRNNLVSKFLHPNREKVRTTETYVSRRFTVVNLLSQYGLYFVIGVVVFVLPGLQLLNKEQVSTFVVILLFIRGPINSLIAMQGFLTKIYVANKRIREFLSELKDISLPEGTTGIDKAPGRIKELRFQHVAYKYPSASAQDGFALGPVDLSIREGETIFIVGGNGSGKSTFIQLLTGIYTPSEGQILLNDTPITADSQYYREHIAAIFSEPHLFSANYEDYVLENNNEYKHLLKKMELDQVITSEDDAAVRRKFSKGQSKRLAMIFALMEKRPLLILDEWAADQDPHFRKFFYEQLLPELQRQGKTIVAVTHDDAYFKYADRVIRFDYGRLVTDISAPVVPALS